MTVDLSRLIQCLGYQFNDEALLDRALTHRSLSGIKNNERLEFLGDSILNFIIGEAIYKQFPKAKEGQLSSLRASLVNGVTLAEMAREFNLSEFLKLGPGELKSGGRRRESILEDAVEALIGAIYNDSGFERCRHVVLAWFKTRLDELSLDINVKDNKTRLQEYLQSHKLPLPHYEIMAIEGKSHSQLFKICCSIDTVETSFYGTGQSRRQAEQVAAGMALADITTR